MAVRNSLYFYIQFFCWPSITFLDDTESINDDGDEDFTDSPTLSFVVDDDDEDIDTIDSDDDEPEIDEDAEIGKNMFFISFLVFKNLPLFFFFF